MPPYAPAQPKPPPSGKVKVPYPFRDREVPHDEDAPKKRAPQVKMWQRHLPMKIVQGSHIGHGIRMEPSRKEPVEWKAPKRRLRFQQEQVAKGGGQRARAQQENVAPQQNRTQKGGAPKKGLAARQPNGATNKPAGAKQQQQQQQQPKPPVAKSAAAAASAPTAPDVVSVNDPTAPVSLASKAVAHALNTPAAMPTPKPLAPLGPSEATVDSTQLLASLQGQAAEVEFLLRYGFDSRADLARARADVADARAFDDELGLLATSHAMLKGRIFQGLLECLRAAGADHAQLDNSAKKQGGGGIAQECGLAPAEWSALADRADALRKLVRVKVADDNDLKTARRGLDTCADFFAGLERLTTLKLVEIGSAADEFTVLQSLLLVA
jgi:hypothetical protein